MRQAWWQLMTARGGWRWWLPHSATVTTVRTRVYSLECGGERGSSPTSRSRLWGDLEDYFKGNKDTAISLAKAAMQLSHWTQLGVSQWQHWGTWHLILIRNWCQLWSFKSCHSPVLRLPILPSHKTTPTETCGSMCAGTRQCMCTRSFLCMLDTPMYVHIVMSMHAGTHLCMYIYTCIYMHVYIYTCICVWCMCVCVCRLTHIHACVHGHFYACWTCPWVCMWSFLFMLAHTHACIHGHFYSCWHTHPTHVCIIDHQHTEHSCHLKSFLKARYEGI